MDRKLTKTLDKHKNLVHSENKRVVSHTQRNQQDWILNTLMIEDCDVAFKYKRKRVYKNLKGARVNLTYYADTQMVAGIPMEVMKVVRIKRS